MERRTCSVEDCNRPHSAHGYCGRHANQFRQHGRVLNESEIRGNFVRSCSVPGCKQRHSAKGYCNKHAKQMERHGRIMPDATPVRANASTQKIDRYTDAHSWSFDAERRQPVSVPAIWAMPESARYRQVPFVIEADGRGLHMRDKIKRRNVRRAAACRRDTECYLEREKRT